MRSTRITALLAGFLVAACSEGTGPLDRSSSLAFNELEGSGDSTVTCTLDSTITVVVHFNGQDYTHIYTIQNGTNGNYTGTASGETITGTMNGTTFTLSSTYTDGSGYTYSLNGTIDPSTGDISGTGSSNQNQAFTFDATSATTCSAEAEDDCPSAPAVANAYLRELGMQGKKVNGQNIISQIAKMTDEDGTFMNLQPCDEGYVQAVRTWIDQQLAGSTTSGRNR
ncbi:MAG TPA: hypothetical protein VF042_14780 [Gemmatimonadaceae bacterium]